MVQLFLAKGDKPITKEQLGRCQINLVDPASGEIAISGATLIVAVQQLFVCNEATHEPVNNKNISDAEIVEETKPKSSKKE